VVEGENKQEGSLARVEASRTAQPALKCPRDLKNYCIVNGIAEIHYQILYAFVSIHDGNLSIQIYS
jgi:hypothetical protein